MKKKPTEEQLQQKILEETVLNRKERRLLKYKKEAMKQVMTHTTTPALQSLAGTSVVKNSTSKGH